MWSIDRDHPYGDGSQDTDSGIPQQDYQFSQTFLSGGGGGTNPVTGDPVLNPGQSITSPNGQFVLTFQTDGNLVEYDAAGQPLWASGTPNEGAVEAVFQTDGNLVVYRAPQHRRLAAAPLGQRDRRQPRRNPPCAGRRQRRDLPGELTTLGDQHPHRLSRAPAGPDRFLANGQFVLTFRPTCNLVEYSPGRRSGP